MENCGLAAWQQTPRFDLKTVRLMDAVPTAYNCSSVCGTRKTDIDSPPPIGNVGYFKRSAINERKRLMGSIRKCIIFHLE